MDDNASMSTLADREAEVKAHKVGETLTDMIGDSLDLALVTSFAQVQAETLGHTLFDVDAEALLYALAFTILEVKAETV